MYLAPEIIKGRKYYSSTTDLFSLGVILFQMRIGFSPFDFLASTEDRNYKLIKNQRFDVFWKHVERRYS